MKDWAEKKVAHIATDTAGKYEATRLLKQEQARTLRILARLEKAAKLDQHTRAADTQTGYLMALKDVRAAVTRGRS